MIPYFDAHCDTLSRCLANGWDLWENPGHLDLRRLGAYDGPRQVFALYGNSARIPPQERFAHVTAQAALLRQAREAGRWGECLLSLEGAELIGCDPERLPEIRGWGVRWVNLTWNHPNNLSGSCLTGEGLTDRGRAFVRACGTLGIGIDVSHLNDRGFWEVLELGCAPVLASHSDCRSLCPHPRNLTDDMARVLFAGGGFVGLNFCRGFLGEDPTLETAADHLLHFLELGGESSVGLGSDFDGADLPWDLAGVEDLPRLWAVLERRGCSEPLLRRIFSENLAAFLAGGSA